MAYGLPLGGEKDERFLSTLNAVEETLCRQLRACKSPAAKKTAVEGLCRISGCIVVELSILQI